uniref:Uncharacterized protein n=1 Tax=Anguilla anguilla TaxID=7936 RepID=A0A0E9QLK7_ANGAN
MSSSNTSNAIKERDKMTNVTHYTVSSIIFGTNFFLLLLAPQFLICNQTTLMGLECTHNSYSRVYFMFCIHRVEIRALPLISPLTSGYYNVWDKWHPMWF